MKISWYFLQILCNCDGTEFGLVGQCRVTICTFLGLFDSLDQVTPEQIKKAMESQMAEDDQKLYEALRFGWVKLMALVPHWIRKEDINLSCVWVFVHCCWLATSLFWGVRAALQVQDTDRQAQKTQRRTCSTVISSCQRIRFQPLKELGLKNSWPFIYILQGCTVSFPPNLPGSLDFACLWASAWSQLNPKGFFYPLREVIGNARQPASGY